jgi:hypothetical protein
MTRPYLGLLIPNAGDRNRIRVQIRQEADDSADPDGPDANQPLLTARTFAKT